MAGAYKRAVAHVVLRTHCEAEHAFLLGCNRNANTCSGSCGALNGVGPVYNHLIVKASAQIRSSVVSLGRSSKGDIARQARTLEVSGQILCCSRCEILSRSIRDHHTHGRSIGIFARVGTYQRQSCCFQVDDVELSCAVGIHRIPVELIGARVHLSGLEVEGTFRIRKCNARRANQSLSTIGAVDLIEVAVGTDTIGRAVVGNTNSRHSGVSRSNRSTCQRVVVDDAILESGQVGFVELTENLTGLRILCGLRSHEAVVFE